MKKLAIVLLATLALVACNHNEKKNLSKREQLEQLKKQAQKLEQQIATLEKELEAENPDETVNVKATPVTARLFEHFIEVTGSTEAEDDVNVSPETAGTIKEIFVTEGQHVSKGQALAQLNTDVLERSREEIEVQLELARTNFMRQKNLWDQRIGSEMQFLQAKSNMEALEKRLESIDSQIELATIKAPIDGVVDIIYQKKGQIAGPQIPFAKVINIDRIKIYAEVSESYLTKIKKGDRANIYFPALDYSVESRIAQISNTIDPNNRTFRVRINLDNSNHLIKPNLISVVKLRDYYNPSAIVIPTLYVKEDFKGQYTYIVEKKDKQQVAKKIYITTGVTDNNVTEIISGLQEGMLLITEGISQISNGTPVALQN